MKRSPSKTLLSALVHTLLIWFSFSCGDSAGPKPAGPVHSIKLSKDSLELWAGETVRVSVELRDAGGVLIQTPVTWQATTNTLSVENGLIRGVTRGTGNVRVVVGDTSVNLGVTVHPVVRGKIHVPVPTPLTSLHAAWNDGAKTDSAQVAADGTFGIRIKTTATKGVLRVDVPSGQRALHPFLMPLHIDSVADADIVMVPRSWSIKSGIYAGQVVAISLNRVMDEPVYLPSYYNGGYFDERYWIEMGGWLESSFPARVMIDHRNSDPQVTPTDSVALWQQLDRMETIFGKDLFKPEPSPATWWALGDTSPPVAGVIRVGYNRELSGSGSALSTLPQREWTMDLGAFAGGGAFSEFYLTHKAINAGSIDLSGVVYKFASPRIIMHEMMHVFGLGHGCPFTTTQAGPCGASEPTREDVAHVELLWAVLALEHQHDTLLGIMPALIGERRLLLNLPALPQLDR